MTVMPQHASIAHLLASGWNVSKPFALTWPALPNRCVRMLRVGRTWGEFIEQIAQGESIRRVTREGTVGYGIFDGDTMRDVFVVFS